MRALGLSIVLFSFGGMAFAQSCNSPEPGITVWPTDLSLVEDGASVVVRVSIDAPPAAGETVTINWASTDLTEATIFSAATLVFDETNWAFPQGLLILPGGSGDGNDGDVASSITPSAVVSGDPAYSGLTAPNINVTTRNRDGIATIQVDPASGLEFREDGLGAEIFISLGPDVVPTADVSVLFFVPPSYPVQLSLDGATQLPSVYVELTEANGYFKTIGVHPQNNGRRDGTRLFNVISTPSTSNDPAFNGIDPNDISGRTIDDGIPVTPGVTVWPTVLELVESQTASQVSVVLNAPPMPGETVQIDWSSSDTTEAAPSPSTIVFNRGNWDVPQLVYVLPGAAGDGNDGDVFFLIVSSAVVSGDPAYNGLAVPDVVVTTDNTDVAARVFAYPASGLVTSEDGSINTSFEVFASPSVSPLADVEVTYFTPTPSEVLLSLDGSTPAAEVTVMLTAANSYTATVTVHGQADNVADGDSIFGVLAYDPVSTDPFYNGTQAGYVSGINLDDQGPACVRGLFHAADQDESGTIGLAELLRLVQFYNSGGYGCLGGTEDGFGPGATDRLCCPHESDYSQGCPDWNIDLSELLRLIQFYNVDGYTACPDDATEDGYCPVLALEGES
ncbi:MAG: hypothetical protein GC168_21645 [Candidatus Hydrogenedens sp.]|nr:hypothetical protein [Candidatus Hydrogenedens sp.]